MSPEIENELHKRYPKVLGYIGSEGEYRTKLWGGFQHGDGWHDLIDTLCACIQQRIESTGESVQVSQVKEKFGSLRFYVVGGDEQIKGMIDLAESLSEKICEECGRPGKQKNVKGWIITRCDVHTPK